MAWVRCVGHLFWATSNSVTPPPNLAASKTISSAQALNNFVHFNLIAHPSHLIFSSRAFLMPRCGLHMLGTHTSATWVHRSVGWKPRGWRPIDKASLILALRRQCQGIFYKVLLKVSGIRYQWPTSNNYCMTFPVSSISISWDNFPSKLYACKTLSKTKTLGVKERVKRGK